MYMDKYIITFMPNNEKCKLNFSGVGTVPKKKKYLLFKCNCSFLNVVVSKQLFIFSIEFQSVETGTGQSTLSYWVTFDL